MMGSSIDILTPTLKATRYLLSMGPLHYKLLLYTLFNTENKLSLKIIKTLLKMQNDDGSFYTPGYGRVLTTADIFRSLSLICRNDFTNDIVTGCLHFLKNTQLNNGLWVDYDVNLDYYRFINDKGIALRITLAVVEGLLNLDASESLLFENSARAILSFQEPEGYWRDTLAKESTWDVEVTARAVRLLGRYMEEDTLNRSLTLLKEWLSSCLSVRRMDQPWALAEVLNVLTMYGMLEKSELQRAIELLIDYQKPNGSWGIVEPNPRLSLVNLLFISKVIDVAFFSQSIKRILKIKIKILETIERYHKRWHKELVESMYTSTSYYSRNVNLNEKLKSKLLRVFTLAYRDSLRNRMDRIKNEKLPIDLFIEYLLRYDFSSLKEHAKTLAYYALEKVALQSRRYRKIGLLLRLLRKEAWNTSPLLVLRHALLLFPNFTIKTADYYLYYLYLHKVFPLSEDNIPFIFPPVDNDLLLVLRRLNLISTPISIAMRSYRLIREEVHRNALELFFDAPHKLYLLSVIAKKWCRGSSRCIRTSREGYVICPLYEVCPSRRNLNEN